MKKNGHLETAKTDLPLDRLILERSHDKYRLVTLAMRWAVEVKQRDQSAEPPQEILSKALKEILSGQVELEAIEKLPPPPKPDPKAAIKIEEKLEIPEKLEKE